VNLDRTRRLAVEAEASVRAATCMQ
jgi:hypothetical protein